MKKFLKITGTLLLATFLALLAAAWALTTPAGLALATPWLARRLEHATGLETRIESLRWMYPLGLKVDRLAFASADGPALRIDDASVRISSRRLLRGTLHVYHVRAAAVAYSGWPSPKADAAPAPAPPSFPGAFPDLEPLFRRVTVQEIAFPDIRLLPPALEEETRLHLSGRFTRGLLDLHAGAVSGALPEYEARLMLRRRESFDAEQELDARLTLSGEDLSLNARLELANTADGPRISLSRLDLRLRDLTAALETPLVLAGQGRDFILHPFDLRVGESQFHLEGSLRGDRLHADARVDAFPLERLGLAGVTDPAAAVDGRVLLSGTLTEPRADLRMDFSGLKPEDDALWEGPPASLRIRAALDAGRAGFTLRIEDLPGDPVELAVSLPLRLSLHPFTWTLPEAEPLEARLTASTDLAGLSRLFVLDVYHRLTGRLDVDIRLDGSLADPRLEGGIRVVDGAYEHELTGLHLRDLEIALSAGRGRLRLDRFQARDGRGGRLGMDGDLLLEPGEEPRFNAELTLQDFQAVRQDQLDAIVNGAIRWSGGLNHSDMQGRLALRPVEIRIPERMPHTVRTVPVVERFDDPRGDEADAPTPERLPRHRITFDVRLDSPDRIFVRGRGLDSEWSANLRMTGELPEPVLTGELAIVRGRFLFFGKRLAVTRGQVAFDGTFPPDPLLDVMAELRSGGILGMLRVSGPASGPVFGLDSTPPLPDDEILARLLFGRESARITPWQALTLARAINSLRGGGSAFDLMGTTRRMLQVDQIEIRSDDEQQGQTRVAVGRYVGDRIFLELERGFEAESGRARVEVEMTPTLRLETQTGTESDSGIGLRWRWDY